MDYIPENHFSVKGKTMIKTIAQWIINLIGYALVALTLVTLFLMIASVLLIALSFYGVFNVDSWRPEQRAHYEKVLQITIPESVEWVRFQERRGFLSDTTILGELHATHEEFAQLFPPEKFPMEDLSSEDAQSSLKILDPDDANNIPRPGCSYKGYTSPFNSENHNIWEIVAEFPSDENERIHVWFVKSWY